jgi:hypothetical protein
MAANLGTRSLTPCVKRPPKQSVIRQPLTIKRHLAAAANGSNRITLKCPRSPAIAALTCQDDPY